MIWTDTYLTITTTSHASYSTDAVILTENSTFVLRISKPHLAPTVLFPSVTESEINLTI